MPRTRPLVPFILLSLLCGLARGVAPSAAGVAGSQSYAGTVTIATSCCSPVNAALVGFNFGEPPTFSSPIMLDNYDQYVPELAARIPTSTNGDIRVVGGNEVITVRLKPGMRWSDGSPITAADYVGALLLETAPTVVSTTSQDWGFGCIALGGPLAAATAIGTSLTLTFNGIFAAALDGCIPEPFPIEYFQRKYHAVLPPALLASFRTNRAAALYNSPSYRGSALQRLVDGWRHDPYTSPHDLFSGPYTLASWRQGQPEVLIPNPYY
ncbi:MAG TPA: ABC transporter substrate-binding protein, partial [Chloroflexota bacterium]|nr:ABC transporter substrate-binding protein [Chloroflexota bacterium]